MTGTLATTTLSDTDWSQDPRFDTVIHRRKTRSVRVRDIWIGSEPVSYTHLRAHET